MLAIQNSKRTKYACNLFQRGPNMFATSKTFKESRDYDQWAKVEKPKLRLLQAYLVPIELKYIEPVSNLGLQVY